jgi:hypothetical protein
MNVTKYALLVPTLFALSMCFDTKEANAQSFHFRSGGVHVDIGHSHHGHRHYGRHGGYSHRRHGHGRWNVYGGYGGHRDWHDTTHLDYHPAHFVPHYDHYDYVPGHYDVHYDGHWDYHHF